MVASGDVSRKECKLPLYAFGFLHGALDTLLTSHIAAGNALSSIVEIRAHLGELFTLDAIEDQVLAAVGISYSHALDTLIDRGMELFLGVPDAPICPDTAPEPTYPLLRDWHIDMESELQRAKRYCPALFLQTGVQNLKRNAPIHYLPAVLQTRRHLRAAFRSFARGCPCRDPRIGCIDAKKLLDLALWSRILVAGGENVPPVRLRLMSTTWLARLDAYAPLKVTPVLSSDFWALDPEHLLDSLVELLLRFVRVIRVRVDTSHVAHAETPVLVTSELEPSAPLSTTCEDACEGETPPVNDTFEGETSPSMGTAAELVTPSSPTDLRDPVYVLPLKKIHELIIKPKTQDPSLGAMTKAIERAKRKDRSAIIYYALEPGNTQKRYVEPRAVHAILAEKNAFWDKIVTAEVLEKRAKRHWKQIDDPIKHPWPDKTSPKKGTRKRRNG